MITRPVAIGIAGAPRPTGGTTIKVAQLIDNCLFTWKHFIAALNCDPFGGLAFQCKTKCQIAQPIFIDVVDQNRHRAGLDVVGVRAVDGQVVGDCGGIVKADIGHRDCLVTDRLQHITLMDVRCLDEGGLGDVVEEVMEGRRQGQADHRRRDGSTVYPCGRGGLGQVDYRRRGDRGGDIGLVVSQLWTGIDASPAST